MVSRSRRHHQEVVQVISQFIDALAAGLKSIKESGQ